jgi:hypothetical protein
VLPSHLLKRLQRVVDVGIVGVQQNTAVGLDRVEPVAWPHREPVRRQGKGGAGETGAPDRLGRAALSPRGVAIQYVPWTQ